MPATPRDATISHSLMFLCLGAAALLLAIPVRTKSTVDTPVARFSSSVPAVSDADSELVVDLSDRRVFVYRSQQPVASYPVAIGQAGWETPIGSFSVQQKRMNPTWIHPITRQSVPPGPSNPLGNRWIGFWSDGQNQIGFHGTNQEDLVGQAVSHGCIRMRNRDVDALYDQIGIGAPVTVRP